MRASNLNFLCIAELRIGSFRGKDGQEWSHKGILLNIFKFLSFSLFIMLAAIFLGK